MENLNPLGQTVKKPRAIPGMETLRADAILESPGARRSMEESTTTTDGVGSGEWLAIMASESTEMPGAMAGATESSEAGAGAADIMPESGA